MLVLAAGALAILKPAGESLPAATPALVSVIAAGTVLVLVLCFLTWNERSEGGRQGGTSVLVALEHHADASLGAVGVAARISVRNPADEAAIVSARLRRARFEPGEFQVLGAVTGRGDASWLVPIQEPLSGSACLIVETHGAGGRSAAARFPLGSLRRRHVPRAD